MKGLLRKLSDELQQQLLEKGWELRWMPTHMRAVETNLVDHFTLAAGHLMAVTGRRDQYFINIGANDGVSNDPIFPFVKNAGWQGILVEPLPEVYETLKSNYAPYKGFQFLNAAISVEDGESTIYSVDMSQTDHREAHQYSSFSKEVILSQTTWTPNIAEMIIEMPIRTVTFETLLSMAGGREIDVLHIDTEGFDLEVLKMIDFARIKPKIVHYEICNLGKADQIAAANLLTKQGYRLAMNRLDATAYLFDEVRFA